MEFLRLQQGNNEWKFTLKGDRDTIKSQRELDPQLTGVPKPTKVPTCVQASLYCLSGGLSLVISLS